MKMSIYSLSRMSGCDQANDLNGLLPVDVAVAAASFNILALLVVVSGSMTDF